MIFSPYFPCLLTYFEECSIILSCATVATLKITHCCRTLVKHDPYPVRSSGVLGSARSDLSLVHIFPKVVAVVLLLSTASPSHVYSETVLYFDSRECLAYCVVECTICYLF